MEWRLGIPRGVWLVQQHPSLPGLDNGVLTRVDAQLAEDGGNVRADGASTEEECLGDLAIGATRCEQPQHLQLALGESGMVPGTATTG